MDAEQLSRASRCLGQAAQTCFHAAPRFIPARTTHLSCAESATLSQDVERRSVWSPAGVIVPFIVVTGVAGFACS
jgi:hypothetical protein